MGMKCDAPGTSNHLSLLPGEVTLKATATVIGLAMILEIVTVNTTPNIVCCRMQVAVLEWPMKIQKTEGEGDEQDVTKSQVFGLDNGSVLVLHQYPKYKSCECREAHICASYSLPQDSIIR
jgi:hypothetical protein